MKLEPNYDAPQFTLSDTDGNPAVVIKTGELVDVSLGAASISLTWNADKSGFPNEVKTAVTSSEKKYNTSNSFTVNSLGLYTGAVSASAISAATINTSGYYQVGLYFQIAKDSSFNNIIYDSVVSSIGLSTPGPLTIPAGTKNIEITFTNTGTHYIRSYWERSIGGSTPNITYNSVTHDLPTFALNKSTAYTELTDYGFQSIRSSTRFVKIQRVGSSTTMLEVGGAITATDNITAYSSDKRLKTNIVLIQNPLEKLNKLSGFTYNWNDKANELVGYDTSESIVGMFAQDVQEVLPEAVKIAPFDDDGNGNSKSGENYLTIQYEKVVPLLVEAMKELKNEIEELKKNK
jgi:hypothetical protein